MAKKDESCFPCWTTILGIGLLAYILLKKFGKPLQNRLFANFWKNAMVQYHSTMREMKRLHFEPMHQQKSADTDLKSKGALRILEIGAGSGGNFEFFPAKSVLTVVEPNEFFESAFHENQRKYPDIVMDRFMIAGAEDMKDIESNSIDIVVSTLVLCSVGSVEKVLKEVQRVLAPGGKFYYWEHVHDTPGTWLHSIQSLLTPLWKIPFDNCELNRSIDKFVTAEKGFSNVEQQRFDIPVTGFIWKFIRVHVKGIATK